MENISLNLSHSLDRYLSLAGNLRMSAVNREEDVLNVTWKCSPLSKEQNLLFRKAMADLGGRAV